MLTWWSHLHAFLSFTSSSPQRTFLHREHTFCTEDHARKIVQKMLCGFIPRCAEEFGLCEFFQVCGLVLCAGGFLQAAGAGAAVQPAGTGAGGPGAVVGAAGVGENGRRVLAGKELKSTGLVGGLSSVAAAGSPFVGSSPAFGPPTTGTGVTPGSPGFSGTSKDDLSGSGCGQGTPGQVLRLASAGADVGAGNAGVGGCSSPSR